MPGPLSIQPNLSTAARTPQEREQAIRSAARQLEGVFVGMMFEEMAKGVGEGGLFPQSPQDQMYQQWFRSEVAAQFSKERGLGLGDAIANQMLGTPSANRAPLGSGANPANLTSLGSGSPTAKVTKRPLAPATVGTPTPNLASSGSGARTDGVTKPSLAAVREGAPRFSATIHRPYLTHDRRMPPPVVGPVTSTFGHRKHPVTGHHHHHNGVDLAVPVGTPVKTPYAGRVAKVGRSKLLGRFVKVEHRAGFSTLYAHLSQEGVQAGQHIPAGSVVGLSGKSGRVTGPHLHFGMFRHGKAIDPSKWVRLSTTR